MSLTDERKNYDELTNLATKESASWKPSSFLCYYKVALKPRLCLLGDVSSLKICENLLCQVPIYQLLNKENHSVIGLVRSLV